MTGEGMGVMTESSSQSHQILCYLVAAQVSAAEPPRNNHSAGKARESLRTILDDSFADAGIDAGAWRRYLSSDDTALVAVNPDVGADRVVEMLPRALLRHIKRTNGLYGPRGQLRLRLALSQGMVPFDDDGPYGIGVRQTLRLLDAPGFVRAWRERPGAQLGVAISCRAYDDLVIPGDLSPKEYERVEDEQLTCAWITFLGANLPASIDPLSVPGTGVRDLSGVSAS